MRLDPAVAACRQAVRQSADDLPAGDRVLVACSGGADSLALAAAALWELPRAGVAVGLICVDHGLQADSAQRSAAVAAWATGAGASPAEVIPVSVGTAGGPEAAARSARYAALHAAAIKHEAAAVLLGHTADDQAETVLLGLARGSGARSLAGMAARRGSYRRPLLGLHRVTTRAACAAQRLSVWDDPHNADPAYARARVRAAVLPALESALGPGVAAALARTAAQLRDDADALDAWSERAAAGVFRQAGAEPVLAVAELVELPAAIRRRLQQRAAREAGVPAGALTSAHLAAIDALITGWHGQGPVALPAGCRVRREKWPLPGATPGPGGRDSAAGRRSDYGVLRFTTTEER